MDGITDSAYRQIVRKLSPETVLFSEFTSINGIEHSQVVRDRLKFNKIEQPYIIQIFGNEPALFSKIVREIDQSDVYGIDINMGCPAKKIIQANAGGSLIKSPDLAFKIVEACVKSTSKPVSVKTRLGWRNADHLVPFVRGLEDAGAAMVTIHGRTYQQKFKGEADWEPIYDLKKAVSIPVIGNGDLKGRDEAINKTKNLDGYMIGRAAIGNPWVFLADKDRETVTLKEKVDTMLSHFQLLRVYKDENKSLIEFRKHITGYINGFAGAKSIRTMLMQSQSENDFIQRALSIA